VLSRRTAGCAGALNTAVERGWELVRQRTCFDGACSTACAKDAAALLRMPCRRSAWTTLTWQKHKTLDHVTHRKLPWSRRVPAAAHSRTRARHMATHDDALAVTEPAPLTLAELPHALLLEVLSRLPVDCRLRCAEVCRAWRDALNERSLWRRLDLSPATGGLGRAADDGLLRAAAAHAAGHLETLDVSGCGALYQGELPAVVAANSASLRELYMRGSESLWPVYPFLNAPAAEVLANALRACSTLTALKLCAVDLWHDAGAAAALLGALTGHASLRTLDISSNFIMAQDCAAMGAALSALVAANAPALTALDVSACVLRDAGLRPLFDALPANTHLAKLECGSNNLTDALACNVLLPAVRANGSLRQLSCWPQYDIAAGRALGEAEALVTQRAAGR
jgi:hypothetical protein